MTALEAQALRLSYGQRDVVLIPELRIAQGSMVCLIGPNGCGKSTLLRALAGLFKPAQGVIRLDDVPLSAWAAKRLARRLAFLPQSPSVPEGTSVQQLVAYGRYAHQGLFAQSSMGDRQAVEWALNACGIAHLRRRDVSHLSGGERQRAWIAMILAQQSDIVLLDEPTTWLDIGHQVELLQLLADLQRQRQLTIVMALHDLNQASHYGERVLAMQHGRIVADGTAQEVMTSSLTEQLFGLVTQRVEQTVAGRVVPYCLPVSSIRTSLCCGEAEEKTLDFAFQ